MDGLNAEKFAMMHAVLSSIKYDWAKYECLKYYINKENVKEGDAELDVNVGYGFMVSHLLKLQGVSTGKVFKGHPSAYLFKPS